MLGRVFDAPQVDRARQPGRRHQARASFSRAVFSSTNVARPSLPQGCPWSGASTRRRRCKGSESARVHCRGAPGRSLRLTLGQADLPTPAAQISVIAWQRAHHRGQGRAALAQEPSRSRTISGASRRGGDRVCRDRERREPAAGRAPALPFSSSGSTALDVDRVLDEPVGRLADQHLSGGGGLSAGPPRPRRRRSRDVARLAESPVTTLPASTLTGFRADSPAGSSCVVEPGERWIAMRRERHQRVILPCACGARRRP